jgi:hypothetical protein
MEKWQNLNELIGHLTWKKATKRKSAIMKMGGFEDRSSGKK